MKNTIIFGYASALNFWLNYRSAQTIAYINKNSGLQINDIASALQMSLPVHIMVASASDRRRDSNVKYHVIPKTLPKGCFRRITNNVYVASPEYCFLQAAEKISVPELVVLANNLCATYAINTSSKYGQEKREPVTTVNRIQGFLESVEKIDGLQKARCAIQYALDLSNSPMESKIAAAGQLPFYHGGFALRKPFLNYSVKMSQEGKVFLGREYCCCDMVWPDLKIAVEYDSSLSHMDENQFFYDKRRTTALVLSGYTVISVTKDHLRNIQTVEDLFMSLRNTLHMTTRKERFEKYEQVRRNTIRTIFFQR